MATELVKAKVTPAKLLADMAHLTPQQLEKVIQGASALQLEKRKIVPSKRESELLRLVNQGLEERKEAELQRLQEKLREETISSREQAQLVRLTDELEQLAIKRTHSLIELAAIRKTSVENLIRELELNQHAYA